MLSARKKLNVITAYREVGTYRGAAVMCGFTHKTVRRILEADRSAEVRVARRRNYESVRALVAAKVEGTRGKIGAKRLLPAATASGYEGSARNFRRLVAQEKARYRQRQAIAGSRRPAVWSPGEYLVIDWGVQDGLHVFCAVLAYSRVSSSGSPTPDYVRFATLYRFRPDFCHARDPASKGIVENLVGYAKRDLMTPQLAGLGRGADGWDLDAANAAALVWCEEVNNVQAL